MICGEFVNAHDREFIAWVARQRNNRLSRNKGNRDTVPTYRAGESRWTTVYDGAFGEAAVALESGMQWDVRDGGFEFEGGDVAFAQVKTNPQPIRTGKLEGDLLVPKLAGAPEMPIVLVYRTGDWRYAIVGYRLVSELAADRKGESRWWTSADSKRFRERRLRYPCWLVPPGDLLSVQELIEYVQSQGFDWRCCKSLREVSLWR